jgi:tetratricopeptide (TPR) repeat protein
MKRIFFYVLVIGILSSCGKSKEAPASEIPVGESGTVGNTQAAPARYQGETIQVLSAVIKDKKIEGATVILQKNGEQSIIGQTDANGQVTLSTPFPDDIDAAIIIKKEGYSTLVAKCPCQGFTYAISPVMSNLDGIRIVLTWGETPEDLDSHLWYDNQHIFFQQKESPDAQLDVDDTDSYGPETVTIENKVFGREYYYAVHDFTNRLDPNSTALSNSHAVVFVYIGQSLVRTYYVPQNRQGNLWTLFKITAGGEIQDINSFTKVSFEDPGLLRYNSSGAIASHAQVNKDEALRLNNLGTKAYESKDYPQAIQYYNAAIEQDPDFGQAYGNLGLTYQKAGMYAEALWANRKAIALASGSTAAVTRAGAYYNIGKMYETHEEYDKALKQYQLAKSEKENTVYDNAIKRMEEKLQ